MKLVGDPVNGALVAGRVDDVVLGELRIERLAERRTELDGRQSIGPAAQRMAVMIDRGLFGLLTGGIAGRRSKEWVILTDDVSAIEAARRLRARGWLKDL